MSGGRRDQPVPGRPSGDRGRWRAACRVACACALLVTLTGCREPDELEVTYGRQRGKGAASVNGTSVLAGMFEEAGLRVSNWSHLAAALKEQDVIVWTPDDFDPPDSETREFFEQWFAEGTHKTLVYIGRDYDAAPAYWETMLAEAPPSERLELMRRLAQATAFHDTERLSMPAEEASEWFTARRDQPRRRVTQLTGPWSEGLDASRSDIRVRGLLCIPTEQELESSWGEAVPTEYRRPDYTPLLTGNEATLVSRITKPTWGEGQVLVVTNGSFLLNLPLVNHEHRKLAGRLIAACGPGERVAFLASGPGGPHVWESMDAPRASTAPEHVVLLVQWCLLGLAYCFCIFPIFGRPKTLPDTTPSEFVQHVDALGELLKRTRDEQYARSQIAHYHTITRRESAVGSSDAEPAATPREHSDIGKDPAGKPDRRA